MKQFRLRQIAKHPDLPLHLEKGQLRQPFARHHHDFHELVVILHGKATHTIDGRSYRVTTGDVYVLLGEIEHGFQDVQNLEYYNVMFSEKWLQGIANDSFSPVGQGIRAMPGYQTLFVLEPFYRKEHRFTNRLRLSPDQLRATKALLQSMLDEYQIKCGKGWQSMLVADFMRLVVTLSRWAEKPQPLGDDKLRAIAQAVAYMESHFTSRLSLPQLATRAHLSARQFSRIFTQAYRLPPMQYLQQLRLHHASQRLRQSDSSVTAIAQECGYLDGNLFSRQFKAVYGMTPSQYRQRHG